MHIISREDMYGLSNTNLNVVNGVPFLTFTPLDKFDFIRHAFSTRFGGVSQDEFSTMNLSFTQSDLCVHIDPKENIFENYRRFCKAVGVDMSDIVMTHQDHRDVVRSVTSDQKGIGLFQKHDLLSVDALVTNEKNLALVTFHADCTPIYFVDPVKKAIGLAHSGWRGTVQKIVKKTVEKMTKCFGTDPHDLVCVIGPTIGQCCYEVDQKVADKFADLSNDVLVSKGNGKYMLDLVAANKKILHQAGVDHEKIFSSGICTKCAHDILFSHRYAEGKRGTMIAMLQIIL